MLSTNFRAAGGSRKMLADLILHSKDIFVPPKTIGTILISPLVGKDQRDVSPKKSLAFTAIKSENLR